MRKFEIKPPLHDELGISVPKGGISLLHDKNGILLNPETKKTTKLPPKKLPIPNKNISVKAFNESDSKIVFAKGMIANTKAPPLIGYADSLWFTDRVTGKKENKMQDNNDEMDIESLQGVHESKPVQKNHPFVEELTKIAQDLDRNINKLDRNKVLQLEAFLINSSKSPINIIYEKLKTTKHSVNLNETLNDIITEIDSIIQNRKNELGILPQKDNKSQDVLPNEEEQSEEEDQPYEAEDESIFTFENFVETVKTTKGDSVYFVQAPGFDFITVYDNEQLYSVLAQVRPNQLKDVVILKKINVSYGVKLGL